MESCQFVAPRSPWGRLGSVLYTCKRLHRMHRRFQHISANSLTSAAHKTMNYLPMASRALGLLHGRRMRRRRLPTATAPTPAPRWATSRGSGGWSTATSARVSTATWARRPRPSSASAPTSAAADDFEKFRAGRQLDPLRVSRTLINYL